MSNRRKFGTVLLVATALLLLHRRRAPFATIFARVAVLAELLEESGFRLVLRMGSCCSTDNVVADEDRTAANRLPPHANWAAQLRADCGSDPSAVARDFSRMDVRVLSSPQELDPPPREPEASDDSSPGYGLNKRPNFDDSRALALKTRRDRVVQSLVGIAKLLVSDAGSASDTTAAAVPALPMAEAHHVGGTGNDSPLRESSPLRASLQQGTTPTKGRDSVVPVGYSTFGSDRITPEKATRVQADRVRVVVKEKGSRASDLIVEPTQLSALCDALVPEGDADLSQPLQSVFIRAGMLIDTDLVPTPMTSSPASSREGATSQKRYRRNEASSLMSVLLAFSQGIMFYPSQRLRHLLWFPWAPHLRDVGWTATVFVSRSSPGAVIVWHEQSVKNYVPEEERKVAPEFRVSWRLELVLDRATGDLLDTSLIVTSARFLTQARSATFKDRQAQVRERLESFFGVEVESHSPDE